MHPKSCAMCCIGCQGLPSLQGDSHCPCTPLTPLNPSLKGTRLVFNHLISALDVEMG